MSLRRIGHRSMATSLSRVDCDACGARGGFGGRTITKTLGPSKIRSAGPGRIRRAIGSRRAYPGGVPGPRSIRDLLQRGGQHRQDHDNPQHDAERHDLALEPPFAPRIVLE